MLQRLGDMLHPNEVRLVTVSYTHLDVYKRQQTLGKAKQPKCMCKNV